MSLPLGAFEGPATRFRIELAAAGPKPGKASELFTTSFTKKYPEIAAKSPVYAQMRNMIDVIIAAAFIRQEDYYGRADWTLGVFADEEALPVETLANPRMWNAPSTFFGKAVGCSRRPAAAFPFALTRPWKKNN